MVATQINRDPPSPPFSREFRVAVVLEQANATVMASLPILVECLALSLYFHGVFVRCAHNIDWAYFIPLKMFHW